MTVAGIFRLIGVLCMAFALTAHAQQYPNRRVTVISSSPGGSVTDVICRLAISNLEQRFKQPFVLDLRLGAGGYIANDGTARSTPDGYTLLCQAEPTLYSDLFNPGQKPVLRELVLISAFGLTPQVMMAPASLKVKTLKEFAELVRQQPNKLAAAFTGNSALMLETISFLRGNQLAMLEVPYQNIAPASQALIRGDAHFLLSPLLSARPLVEGNNAVILAVSSAQRFPLAQEIPTAREQGFDVVIESFFGLFGPAKTPADIVGTLRKATDESMSTPESAALMRKFGAGPVAPAPAELSERVAQNVKRYTDLIQKLNLSQQK